MSLLDTITQIRCLSDKSTATRFESDESIIFKFEDRRIIELEFQLSNLGFECIGEDEIELDIFCHNGLFYDLSHFIKYCSSKTIDLSNTDIGIIFFEANNYLFYDSTSKKTFLGKRPSDSIRLIQNALSYLVFVDEFKCSELITYHDDARREFVVISPEKGKQIIGYPLFLPNIPNELDLADNLELFRKRNKSEEFCILLREQIIESLSSFGKDNRFPQLAYKIPSIIDSASRNYETYLNKFSFEELKKNFRKERDEYFLSLRDIIGKLLDKIISIPISVSAAAIAIYNLKSEPNYVAIVTISYLVYSIFACYLLRLLQNDVLEIKSSLDNDIEIIKQSSNIPNEILIFEGNKIYHKINRLNIIIIIIQLLYLLLSNIVLIAVFDICRTPELARYLSIAVVCIFHLSVIIFKIKFKVLGLDNK